MRLLSAIALLVWCFIAPSTSVHAELDEEQPLVFAASSLTAVLAAHAANWSELTEFPMPRFSFGASATMARQINAGAPAHIFISANPVWVEKLTETNRIEKTANVATNQLVLVSPATKSLVIPFKPSKAYFELLIGDRKLALADPKLAPLGAYSQRYLQKISLWADLKDKLAYGQNARQTLRLAEQGGLPAFVYRSDALMSEKVTILYAVPAELTNPIIYKAALLSRAGTASKKFFDYLMSVEAQPTWTRFGFREVPKIAPK